MFIVGLALLLLGWPIFVLPALGASGRARGVAILAVLAGASGLGWELWVDVLSGASASIRLDLFGVAVVLLPLYLWAAVEAWRAGWTRVGWTGSGLTVVALILMSVAWQEASRAAERLDLALAEGSRLMFEAKFRNEEAYARYFAMDANESDFPVGHWEAIDRRSITRVVINPAGKLRAFFGEDPERQFGEGAPLEPRPDADGWHALLVYRGVGQRQLTIQRPSNDTMSIAVDGQPMRFRLAPPPLFGLPEPDGLEYLGAFSAAVPYRDRMRVSQVWLWRDAEGLLAIGALDHLFPGRQHDFITPLRWGRGVPTPEGSFLLTTGRGAVR